jgi:biotin transport system substrate-specific component
VPLTLQTFFVLLGGALLGGNLGAITQFSYIIIGIAVVPVFSGAGSGWLYLLGPTGGYLVGFVAAAYVTGRILHSAKAGMARAIVSFAAGSLIIYAFGMLWLISLYGMSATHAALAGALPFVPGDMAKVLVAAVIYSRISPRIKQIFQS